MEIVSVPVQEPTSYVLYFYRADACASVTVWPRASSSLWWINCMTMMRSDDDDHNHEGMNA